MLNQTSVDMNCNLLLPMTSSICLYTHVRVCVCVHTYNLYFITIIALFKFHISLKRKLLGYVYPYRQSCR